jgi:hypothetical protein
MQKSLSKAKLQSRVSTNTGHLWRITTPSGLPLSTHHALLMPKRRWQVNGRTWSVPRKTSSWTLRQRRTWRLCRSNLESNKHRRYTSRSLQIMSSNAMLSIEWRRQGRRHRVGSFLNLGFHPKTSTKPTWERGSVPTHTAMPPRRGTTPTGAVATGTDRRRTRLSSVLPHTSPPTPQD